MGCVSRVPVPGRTLSGSKHPAGRRLAGRATVEFLIREWGFAKEPRKGGELFLSPSSLRPLAQPTHPGQIGGGGGEGTPAASGAPADPQGPRVRGDVSCRPAHSDRGRELGGATPPKNAAAGKRASQNLGATGWERRFLGFGFLGRLPGPLQAEGGNLPGAGRGGAGGSGRPGSGRARGRDVSLA